MAKRHLPPVLAIVLVLIFISINTSYAVGYSDIENHWARKYILPLLEANIISGYPDGSFRPNDNITVAEFTKMVLASSKIKVTESSPWYKSIMDSAMKHGLIESGEFDNYDKRLITRGEMARIIVRQLGIDSSKVEKTSFTDDNEIPENLKGYIKAAADEGIITGMPDGRFDSNGNATRAEAATIVYRMLNPMDEIGQQKEADQTKVGKESWVGKYYEFVYFDLERVTFAKDAYGQEYIPYIELLDNGKFNLNLNWYVDMMSFSGSWTIDDKNPNIVHLTMPREIEHKVILERLFDGAIAIRGYYEMYASSYNLTSTTLYGTVFLKEGMDLNAMAKKAISEYPNYWTNIYVWIVRDACLGGNNLAHVGLGTLNRLDYIKSARLYDMDDDGVPELILGDSSDKAYYGIKLKDGKPTVFDIEADNPIIGEKAPCIINSRDPEIQRTLQGLNRFIDYADGYIINNPR